MTQQRLTDKELGIIGVVRLGERMRAHEKSKRMRITYNWVILSRLKVQFSWRSSKCLWGRFGGGWQWALGFEASRSCVILNLLICSVRISWYKEKEEK